MKTKSKGLGDTIAKVTKYFGIDKAAKQVAKSVGAEDCGCSKRQDTLNRVFPYSQK